jgi:putative oxidoreductase
MLAFFVPGLEILITLLLIIPRTRRIGLYISISLLTLFSIYLIYMVSFTPHLPCSCGGVISKLTWRQHIFFNLFFIAITLIALSFTKKESIHLEKYYI